MPRLLVESLQVGYHGAPTVLRGVSLRLHAGKTLAVLGPSGCGKTTLLRAIAGLEPASAGRVVISGVDRTRAEPSARGVALVFQDGALYPHLSVRDNLAFGLDMRGVPRAHIDARVRDAIALARLHGLEARRPGSLSGGERQRAALAKALAASPAVLLLDEPLASLDAPTRGALRDELRSLYARLDAAVVHVTHDQEEALALGDEVAVMIAGRFEHVGAPAEVYHRPRTRAVATFVGWPTMNFVPGRCEHRAGAAVFVPEADASLALPVGPDTLPAGPAVLGLRPHALRPAPPGATGWPARVLSVSRLGAVMDLRLETGAGVLAARLPDAPVPAAGEAISLHVDPAAASLFAPGPSGEHLGS